MRSEPARFLARDGYPPDLIGVCRQGNCHKAAEPSGSSVVSQCFVRFGLHVGHLRETLSRYALSRARFLGLIRPRVVRFHYGVPGWIGRRKRLQLHPVVCNATYGA